MDDNLHYRYESEDEDIVGRYKLTKTLGHGSYGIVKLANDIHTKKAYAVKLFSKKKLISAKRNTCLKWEISILQRCKHQNILEFKDIIDTENVTYLVTEFCEKGILMNVYSNNDFAFFSEKKSRHYFDQLYQGVKYLHSIGVIHCDIKPHNILIDGNDVLKISDFGCSVFENVDETKPGIAGSVAFLPPEKVKGCTHITFKVDIWGMGCVLYCMTVGRIPFGEENIEKVKEKILRHNPEIPEGLDYELEMLLLCMLCKDPEERPAISDLKNFGWLSKSMDEFC